MQDGVPRFLRQRVSLLNGQAAAHGQVHLRVEPVPDPAHPHIGHAFHAAYLHRGFADLVGNRRIHPVNHPQEDHPRRRPKDPHNQACDQQADERIGEWESEPDPGGATEDGQARQPVRAGVVSVGDQGRAVDLLADANPEERHKFVPQKPDHGRGGDRAQILDRLRLQHPPDGLDSCDHGAEQDQEDDGRPGEVLHLAIAVRESVCGLQAGQAKAIQSGTAVRASPKLWIVSANRATLPESPTTTT